MILTKALEEKYTERPEQIEHLGSYSGYTSSKTKSGQVVTNESAKTIAAFYRVFDMICSDVAAMPFKSYTKTDTGREIIAPNSRTRNLQYQLEIQPNNYGWTPWLYNYAAMTWLLGYGNCYEWSPPVRPAQKFVLRADRTRPVIDARGNIWYETYFDNAKAHYLPNVEVMHTLINPDASGHVGRGIVTFARETVGRRMAANEAASELYDNGMNAKAYMQVSGAIKKELREKMRKEYLEKLKSGLVLFDSKVLQFEPITLSLADSQFVEQNMQTDRDIANFFGVSEHFINQGKQSYQSNYQKYEEYLIGPLNKYLVQREQAARINWLPQAEQGTSYFKYNRAALLRMSPKERAETNEVLIRSAQLKPSEARAMEDRDGGIDEFVITKNYATIGEDGQIISQVEEGNQNDE
jgi:HK97 family phage portal protein